MKQLGEVVAALDLSSQSEPVTRCMDCNGPIRAARDEEVAGRIDPAIQQRFDHFWLCEHCRKVYWQGSHYQRMLRAVRRFAADAAPADELAAT